MQVATGTVVDGKVVVEGAELPEGAVVTILSRGAAAGFRLTREQEDELLDALAEIDRGESVTLEELLASLAKLR
jgi:predicted transcriptional regulator